MTKSCIHVHLNDEVLLSQLLEVWREGTAYDFLDLLRGYRDAPPQEVYQKHMHKLSPLTAVVRNIKVRIPLRPVSLFVILWKFK